MKLAHLDGISTQSIEEPPSSIAHIAFYANALIFEVVYAFNISCNGFVLHKPPVQILTICILKYHDSKIPTKVGGINQDNARFWFTKFLFYNDLVNPSLYCPGRNPIFFQQLAVGLFPIGILLPQRIIVNPDSA